MIFKVNYLKTQNIKLKIFYQGKINKIQIYFIKKRLAKPNLGSGYISLGLLGIK